MHGDAVGVGEVKDCGWMDDGTYHLLRLEYWRSWGRGRKSKRRESRMKAALTSNSDVTHCKLLIFYVHVLNVLINVFKTVDNN